MARASDGCAASVDRTVSVGRGSRSANIDSEFGKRRGLRTSAESGRNRAIYFRRTTPQKVLYGKGRPAANLGGQNGQCRHFLCQQDCSNPEKPAGTNRKASNGSLIRFGGGLRRPKTVVRFRSGRARR